MTVFFIGAGPGDPELITVKGQRLVRSCPVILYAGSLVPAAVLEGHSAVQVVNTAELDLDQIVALLKSAHDKGQDVARVHSGDPSLYGAIGCELTLPDISQTLILTRYATKTTMPEGEQLADLARHRATMAIHLGVRHLARIVEELRPHYGGACPIAVIYRASWPDEEQITGTLDDILGKVQSTQIERTALILVGQVLSGEGFANSTLYAKA
jgi:precorrin-4/cobalt-precorrin-4 C11-methyltransferase